jgi:O-methyltransferase
MRTMNRLVAPVRELFDQFRLRPAIRERLTYWTIAPEYRQWCQVNACEVIPERDEFYGRVLEREALEGPIDFLEFGVAYGSSLRWWVEHNRHPETTFVGFDTFEGLPEKWECWPAGTFTTNGKPPAIPDERIQFVKGLFQETLPQWLAGREFTRRTVVHLDADLYTSTLVVLTQLLPKLKNGTILIFDEFDNCLHEYRAFRDALAAYRREYEPVCHTPQWVQSAFKLT